MTALAILLGGGVGIGLLVAWRGLRGRAATPPMRRWRPPVTRVQVGTAAIGAALALAVTRWPVAGLAGAMLGLCGPALLSGMGGGAHDAERSEAVAAWAELLRDTMGAAVGLEQAIRSTAPIAPLAIRPQVRAMVTRLEHERLAPSLARLADDLADPTADLVVVALTLAASGEAQDLGDLLGSLAGAARDGATLRLRMAASRARTRTSVRIITGVTVAMVMVLVLLNRDYLSPFDTVTGQGVLALVVACFVVALWWLARMSRFIGPERFLSGRAGSRVAP